MAIRFNPATAQWEDDGAGVVNPVVAPVIQGPPLPVPEPPGPVIMDSPLERMLAQSDTVLPDDLVKDTRRPVYTPSGALSPVPAPAAAGQPAGAMPSEPLMGGGGVSVPPVIAPMPAKKTAGGGGGGGGQEARLSGDLTRVQGEQEAALKGEQKTAKERAGAESENAADVVAQRQAEQTRLLAAKQAAEAEHARLSATADAEDQKYKRMGFENFWSNATVLGKKMPETGARILGLIGVALGTAGAAMSGGRNYAMEQIDKLIANDYQRQRDEILKQKDVVSEARGLAKEARAEKLLALETWRKNAYELTEAKAKAKIAAMGPAAVDAKGASALADLHEKAIESKMALEKGQAQLANTRADTALKRAEAARAREAGKGGTPSAGELGAAADASGILTNLEAIGKLPQLTQKDLEKVNSNRTLLQTSQAKGFLGGVASVGGKLTGIVPNSETEGLDAKKQQAYLAWQNVRSGMAHVLTGAGMSDSEREDYIRRYTPQPGDSNSTIAAKFIQGRQFVKDQLIKAGRAAPQVQQRLDQLPAPGGGAAPAPTSRPARIRTRDGRTARLGADGQYYAEP